MNIGSVEYHGSALGMSNEKEVVRVGRINLSPAVCSDNDYNDDDQSTFSMQKQGAVDKMTAKEAGLKLADKKKRRKQKKWKKPKDKPSRPLSAYNLFFQAERSSMLGKDAPSAALEDLKKRVHCKTHGKIGFAEMARAIGAKWKSLEPAKKQVYEDRARKEKARYTAELTAWKDSQKDGTGSNKSCAASIASSSAASESAGGATAMEIQNNGLDAIATAAAMAASDPMEEKLLKQKQQQHLQQKLQQQHQLLLGSPSHQHRQRTSPFAGVDAAAAATAKPSDALRMALAADVGVHRRHLALLQQQQQQQHHHQQPRIQNDLDYFRALQNRQETARLLGLSRLESSLMNKYPSAAEASANALMQQFQGLGGAGVHPHHHQASAFNANATSASHRLLEAELAAASSTLPSAAEIAAMRQYQRQLMARNAFNDHHGLCR